MSLLPKSGRKRPAKVDDLPKSEDGGVNQFVNSREFVHRQESRTEAFSIV